MLKFQFVFVLGLIFLMSCGKKVEEGGISSEDLQGSWSVCKNDYSNSISLKRTYSFSGNELKMWIISYSSYNCNSNNKDVTLLSDQNFSINQDVLNMIIQDVFLIPHTQDRVDYYNSSTHCGFDDWAVGVTKNVINETCGSTTISFGDTDSGSISISGNTLTIQFDNGPLVLTKD